MPYLVLAFGLVMSVVGVLLISFGYPIIHDERGWATVIAGATLVAGGSVTAALGLVLKAIGDIGRAAPQSLGETAAIKTSEVPAFAPPRFHASSEEPAAPPVVSSLDLDPLLNTEVSPAEPEAWLTTKASPAEPTSMPMPTMDDWLERSFADFDREVPAPPAKLNLPPVPEPEPSAEALVSEPEPAAPEATSAVIGRYEADGTSYVMYADGSIEAQSTSGVFRFASMADLKSFIEG